VLVGVSGSGKSTWAAQRYARAEIVSSDALRGVVGFGEADISASDDALSILDQIVVARLGRRLTTVVDSTALDADRRLRWLGYARAAGLPAHLVLVDTPAPLARARNAARDRQVPAAVITDQLGRYAEVQQEIRAEGWDEISTVAAELIDPAPPPAPAPAPRPAPEPVGSEPGRLSFVLQLSRFGWPEDDPSEWLRAMAEATAAAGFDGIALMDHLIQIPQVGRAWEPIPEPWVTLGLLAGLGLGLRLGTLVTPVGFRPPGVTAKAAATLDVLSGGRAFLGVGAGWWAREHAAFGLDFPTAGQRLDALDRGVETIRALWSPGTKPYVGDGVELPETTCYPRPTADIPIIVGGSGERRTLRIAAARGDACNLPSQPDVLGHKISVVRGHCRDLGRDPAELAITVLDVTAVGRDRDEVGELVARLHGRTDAARWAARHQVGTVADQVSRYAALADRGVSTAFVALPQLRGPDDLAAFAPVVDALRATG
jgi:alkanesulfonate monooxygenase SsuD/methylene tetrahydromethanopterin reductase-like flavin-dependent oxidoreductase (luciferase family)/predicted kinase